jgi:hypothetical protein
VRIHVFLPFDFIESFVKLCFLLPSSDTSFTVHGESEAADDMEA